MASGPDCFVLMPFGLKPDPAGKGEIDFDHVYEAVIEPGVRAAGMEPLRGDFEKIGGIIHRPMFERLLLCEFAVADLTTGNPNVFYELGVRHAVRPGTTLSLAADEKALPFDVAFLKALPYRLGPGNRFAAADAQHYAGRVRDWLDRTRERKRGAPDTADHDDDVVDSPLFQLIGEYRAPDLTHLKTDAFSERIARTRRVNREIDAARASARLGTREGMADALARLDAIRDRIADPGEAEAGVLVDLMLAYRAVSAWDRMIALQSAMPGPLKRQTLPREQRAFALNRRAEAAIGTGEDEALSRAEQDRQEALAILNEIEARNGPNPETCGLIGRIHKARWQEAVARGQPGARGHLNQAVKAYRRGFHADWRDYFPGVNLATLLHLSGTREAKRELAEVVPVVRFAVVRRLERDPQDYWKHATLLELAVLAGEEDAAWDRLEDARAAVREDFQPRTTANNLRLLAGAAEPDGTGWRHDVAAALIRGFED